MSSTSRSSPVVAVAARPLPIAHLAAVVVLVAVAAGYGLVVQDAYREVPDLLRQTWRAQDAVTLATLPVLVWTTRRARAGSLPAHLVAVGVFSWLAYGYAHLAIGAPFNDVFLVYVAVLGLAAFAMLDGLLRVDVRAVAASFVRAPGRAGAIFLAVAGLGIAGLWLSDIIVGLTGGVPANLHLAALPNPTWVLDLAWIIPWALEAAAMLWRDHPAGPVVSGVLLVMLLILSGSMLVTVPFALAAGLGDDPDAVAQLVAFTIVFTVLAAVELWLLVTSIRRLDPVPTPWLRPGWWPTGPDDSP